MPDTESAPRTFRKAVKDIVNGAKQRQLWGHLAWQDLAQRYRRSVLGPWWITIAMVVTAGGLGVMYAGIFNLDPAAYIPYMTTGFMLWYFISGVLIGGAEVFIQNEGLLKQLPAPLSVHVFRTVWREVLLFLHNFLVYLVILAVFRPPITWQIITVFPALLLLLLNAGWIVLVLGVVSTRFRDIPAVISSFMQMLFFLSPIVWPVRVLEQNAPDRAWLAQINPIYHVIELVRAPLLGEPQRIHHWLIVCGFAVVGWLLALLVLRNYRARVPYWV